MAAHKPPARGGVPGYAQCPANDNRWWYLFTNDEFRQRYEALRPDCARGTGEGNCYVWARLEGRVTPPMTRTNPWYRSRAATVTRLIDMWPIRDCAGPEREGRSLYVPWAIDRRNAER